MTPPAATGVQPRRDSSCAATGSGPTPFRDEAERDAGASRGEQTANAERG
jgi:hypothetical protein